MNDLGIIKRDVLSEIERDRKYAQITLETTLADNTLDYKEKVLKVKELIGILADSDVMANATNNIFVDNSQASQQPSVEPTDGLQSEPSNVVDALNQSHSE